uniref:Uncharacterized protein n=1 Tax=Oncorhynchus kisutch TaxID=8019 RepID=A0A8C7KCE7_ONCKI
MTSPDTMYYILKQFTKAAIRTLMLKIMLIWSCICCCYIGYFSALSKGDILPIKERLERPVATQKTDTRLTPGLLKVLNKQILAPIKTTISMEELQQKWKGLCQPSEQLDTSVSREKLWCSSYKYACEILTEYEGGGAATMPFDLFAGLYTLPGPPGRRDPQDQIDSFLSSGQYPLKYPNPNSIGYHCVRSDYVI